MSFLFLSSTLIDADFGTMLQHVENFFFAAACLLYKNYTVRRRKTIQGYSRMQAKYVQVAMHVTEW